MSLDYDNGRGTSGEHNAWLLWVSIAALAIGACVIIGGITMSLRQKARSDAYYEQQLADIERDKQGPVVDAVIYVQAWNHCIEKVMFPATHEQIAACNDFAYTVAASK